MAPEASPLSRPASAVLLVGGLALVAAGAVDLLGVLGRHARLPVVGSIELVQACVIVAASASIVAATLARIHATVHVITERLPKAAQGELARLAAVLGAIFFASLTAGSVWLAVEHVGADERTDLLGIPLLPFRILWCLASAVVTINFLWLVVRPAPQDEPARHDA